MERLGGVVAADEAVLVEVDALGLLVLAPLEVDVHGTASAGGVEAEQDGLADKRGIDLVDDAEEADGAVPLDLAFLLEEKHLVQFRFRPDQVDVVGGHHPAVERGHTVEARVRAPVILALDPGPQPAVEGVQTQKVGATRVRREPGISYTLSAFSRSKG